MTWGAMGAAFAICGFSRGIHAQPQIDSANKPLPTSDKVLNLRTDVLRRETWPKLAARTLVV